MGVGLESPSDLPGRNRLQAGVLSTVPAGDFVSPALAGCESLPMDLEEDFPAEPRGWRASPEQKAKSLETSTPGSDGGPAVVSFCPT